MVKNKINFKLIILSILIICSVSLFVFISNKNNSLQGKTIVAVQDKQDVFRYMGKNGIDALTLLRSFADIDQDNSGLVTSINGRKAVAANREFWAFYINDEIADRGPAYYATKDGDTIQWKIENY